MTDTQNTLTMETSVHPLTAAFVKLFVQSAAEHKITESHDVIQALARLIDADRTSRGLPTVFTGPDTEPYSEELREKDMKSLIRMVEDTGVIPTNGLGSARDTYTRNAHGQLVDQPWTTIYDDTFTKPDGSTGHRIRSTRTDLEYGAMRYPNGVHLPDSCGSLVFSYHPEFTKQHPELSGYCVDVIVQKRPGAADPSATINGVASGAAGLIRRDELEQAFGSVPEDATLHTITQEIHQEAGNRNPLKVVRRTGPTVKDEGCNAAKQEDFFFFDPRETMIYNAKQDLEADEVDNSLTAMTQAVPIECIQEALEKGRCQITSQLGLVASTFHLREALDRIRSGEQASAGSVPI